MANHLRCPMCGRNVRYSKVRHKVVGHNGRQVVTEPYQIAGVPEIYVREVIRPTGKLCPTSGMRMHEVRQLKVTLIGLGHPVFGRPDPEFVSGVTG